MYGSITLFFTDMNVLAVFIYLLQCIFFYNIYHFLEAQVKVNAPQKKQC